MWQRPLLEKPATAAGQACCRTCADMPSDWKCRRKKGKKKQLPCVLWVCPNLEITRAQRGQRLNRISQQLSPAGELLPSTWMTAGESRIHQNPPFGLLSAGRIFQWNLDKSHHVEFGLKEEGGSPQSGAAATGEAFQFPPFSGLLRDHA